MEKYVIHFSNGETMECKSRAGIGEFINGLNDNRTFFGVEDISGQLQIVNKRKIEYITNNEY